MPDETLNKMSSSFGTDFSDVNIHSDSKSATDAGALAYTQGNDIHFAPGQYDPSSQSGQELLGHELTHVQQQREGRVQANNEVNGMPLNDDKGLEAEADEGGRMAVQMKEDSIKTASKLVTQSNIIQKKSSFVIQMITDEDLGARADQADAARTPFVFDPTTITNMERPTPTSDDTDIARKLSIWPELRVKRNEKISLQTGEYEASTGFDLDSYSGDRGPGGIVSGPRRGPERPEEVTRIRARREVLNREIQNLLESVNLHTEAEFDSIVASLPSRFEAKRETSTFIHSKSKCTHRPS
ncbi:MAG: DUF4157 domain-containing protein [Saprospiraceae bacterium]|nr:DUF4157 domain-containing protein [Candidatus Brachybacter algidus]